MSVSHAFFFSVAHEHGLLLLQLLQALTSQEL